MKVPAESGLDTSYLDRELFLSVKCICKALQLGRQKASIVGLLGRGMYWSRSIEDQGEVSPRRRYYIAPPYHSGGADVFGFDIATVRCNLQYRTTTGKSCDAAEQP